MANWETKWSARFAKVVTALVQEIWYKFNRFFRSCRQIMQLIASYYSKTLTIWCKLILVIIQLSSPTWHKSSVLLILLVPPEILMKGNNQTSCVQKNVLIITSPVLKKKTQSINNPLEMEYTIFHLTRLSAAHSLSFSFHD